MPKDGNCLFHALASFFEHPGIRHDVLRRMIVHYIYQNPEYFEVDVTAEGYADLDHYCENMARDRYWGDGTVLQAFAMLFQVTVYVYYSEHEPPTCLQKFDDDRPVLAVLLKGNHYERIIGL